MLKIYDQVESHHFTKKDDVLIGTDVKYTETCNLGDLIFKTLDSKLNHVSQIDGCSGQSTTFAEMKDRSVRCALWLQKMGFGTGDIITCCTDNQLDAYIPIFATFYIGAIYNPWYDKNDLTTAQRLMRLMQPKVIFAIEATVGILMEAAHLENVDTQIIVFGKDSRWPSINKVLEEFDDEEVTTFRPLEVENPKQAATITFTSGSTGIPKAIVHSYENIIKRIQLLSPHAMKDVAWWNSPPTSLLCMIFVLQCIMTYGTRIIAKLQWSDYEQVCKLIERYKIKRILANPRIAAGIQDYIEKYDFQSLQLIFITGFNMPVAGLKRLKNMLPNTQVSVTYGLTEISGCCAAETNKTKCAGSVGFVVPNCQLKIVDPETGETLGANQKGEICVKTDTVMIGYYNTELNDEEIDRQGWLHTGDLGYFDDNGEIFIIDRLKEITRVGGIHVSPVEIEEHLLSHPDIAEAAVVFVPNLEHNNHAVAFVKRSFGANVTKQDLIELSSVLGNCKKLWGGVEFVDEIPKTPSGKLNRVLLKREALRKYGEKRVFELPDL